MLMFKVKYNILNSSLYEVSRYSYVKKTHYVQFITYYINSLWKFSCDICTYPAINLPFHGIWTYPQILSNVNIFMIGWNIFWSNSETWNLKQCVFLDFLCVFQLQNMFGIHLFVPKVYLLLQREHFCHNIQVKILNHTLPLSFIFG